MRLKAPILTLTAAGLVLACSALARTEEALPPLPPAPVKPALEGNRGPYEVAFTPDGQRAVVTEYDEGALAIIDTATGEVEAHISTGGTEPTGVAVTPDGRRAVVTNSFSGSVAIVDLEARRAETFPMRGMPYDVVLSPDGALAYVSQSQLDQVAVLDLATRKVLRTLPTGRRPRSLAMTPDGTVLATANLTQGSVTFLDLTGKRPPAESPTPAVNLRGVALFPGGRMAYPVAQRAQNERPTESPIGIWSNQAFRVVPNGRANGVENIWLDLIGKDVSDPESVVFDPQGKRAFITCSGGHSVNVLPFGDGDVQVVQGVGACPKGLAFTPDGKEVWVANSLSNDLAVIDPTTLAITRRISLGPTQRKDPHLLGHFLFDTATITRGAQFSCNSCHPDGTTDGISWKFVHVKDALGREITRNVRSLRGEVTDTAPFRWTGQERDIPNFVKDELLGLLKTPTLDTPSIEALAGYVASLPLPPNPYRNEDGSLTESAERGKTLFAGKAACATCHTGPKAGGQRAAWIGTTPQGVDLDVPHLVGVYDTYPYLHDGRAPTLASIFTGYNENKLHGKAHELDPAELKDLLEYVREL